jgi:hypothetical protein
MRNLRPTFEKLLECCKYDPTKTQNTSDWRLAWYALVQYAQFDVINKTIDADLKTERKTCQK